MNKQTSRTGQVSKGFLIAAVVALVGVPGGFLVYKSSATSKRSAEERQDAARVLFSFPLYNENKDYFETMLDAAHPAAFKEGYDSGGLFAQSEFDEATYNQALARELLRLLREQNNDRATELAKELDEHFESMPALFN